MARVQVLPNSFNKFKHDFEDNWDAERIQKQVGEWLDDVPLANIRAAAGRKKEAVKIGQRWMIMKDKQGKYAKPLVKSVVRQLYEPMKLGKAQKIEWENRQRGIAYNPTAWRENYKRIFAESTIRSNIRRWLRNRAQIEVLTALEDNRFELRIKDIPFTPGNPLDALNVVHHLRVQMILRNRMNRHRGHTLKIYTTACFELYDPRKPEEEQTDHKPFWIHSPTQTVLQYNEENLSQTLAFCMGEVEVSVDNRALVKSSLAVKEVKEVRIILGEFQPFRGAEYIPSPENIAKAQACINIKNDDVYC
jgi:hypothetical protein